MKKISKLQFAQFLPVLVMLVLSLLMLALSPVFPKYELWRGGVLGLSLLFFAGLLMLYISWIERLKQREDNSGEEK